MAPLMIDCDHQVHQDNETYQAVDQAGDSVSEWYKFKIRVHIQNWATNYLVELAKEDMDIANKNWGHSENIIIAMLADPREEVRRLSSES